MQVSVSSCRAIVFHYTKFPSDGGGAPNLEVQEISIEREIKSFEFSKTLGSASGSFTLELTANVNWKKAVFPTDWIMVYMSNAGDSKEKLRLLGNIDRVSQFTTRNDKGLLETSYVISGRDFGKIFEETRIWFNPQNPVMLAPNLDLMVGTPAQIVDLILRKFLNAEIPLDIFKGQPQLNQWFVPNALAIKFLANGNRFYNLLKSNINSKIQGNKSVFLTSLLQGALWQTIKNHSNDVVNEIFVELIDEVPTFVMRQKPFTSDKVAFSTPEMVKFSSLPRIEITGEEIIGSDIGFSDQERFNIFLLVPTSDMIKTETSINLLTTYTPSFPAIEENSIKRHGLKNMYVDTEYAFQESKEGNYNAKILHNWNRLIFDWYNNAVFYETGTLEIKKAHPDLCIGKALVIKDSQVNENKIFYIEGYTDSWSYPGIWQQTVQLTRGQTLDKSGKIILSISDKSKTNSTIFTGQTSQLLAKTNPKSAINNSPSGTIKDLKNKYFGGTGIA